MNKFNCKPLRIFAALLCIILLMTQLSLAQETSLSVSAVYNSSEKLITVNGSAPGAWVSMYLLYPGKSVADVSSHSDSNPVMAHVWQIPVSNGAYTYSFDPNVTSDGIYTVHVKAGTETAETTVDVSEIKSGNIYGLPTDTYGAITGSTTKERFISARAELPDEMPVYTPVDIEGAVKVFVDPAEGDDDNPGTIDAPVATVQKAVALSKNVDLSGGCVIFLRGGVYDSTRRIQLQAVNGTETKPYIVSAYNGEDVTFTDGYSLSTSDMTSASDMTEVTKIPDTVKNEVKVFDLTDCGITDYATADKMRLTIDDISYNVSRWPNVGTTAMAEYTGSDAVNGVINPGSADGMEFCIADIHPYTWQNTGEIMLIGSFNSEYWTDAVTLKAFNPAKGSVITNEVISHGASYGAKYSSTNTFYWANVIEELDSPGEFFIDKANNKLYVYPMKEIMANSEVILSCSPEYTNRYAAEINSSSNIVINGIDFKSCSKQNVMSVNNAENVLVQNCTFRNSVGGILIGSNTEFCGVVNSVFENINSFYPIVTSKDASSEYVKGLKPQYNFVQNNYFYDCSHIIIRGVGDIISHNYFSNTPGGAIYCDSSNEVIIEYNEIVSYGITTDDCGAIYIGGRNAAASGVHVRYNYIHDASSNAYDSGASRGIYLDDLNSGTYVYGNVLEDAKVIFVHSGSDNAVYNNIIINGGSNKAIADSENYMYDSLLRKSAFVPNYLASGATHSRYLDESDTTNYIDVLSADSPYKKRYPAMSEWSELLSKRITEYRSNTAYQGEGKSKYTQSYTNGTTVNLDYYLTSPRYNYYDCNVVVGDDYFSSLMNTALTLTDTGKISAEIGTNKYYYKYANPFADGYTQTSFDTVRQNVSGFEDIDVDRAGIITVNSDSDYASNTWTDFAQLKTPQLLSPENGANISHEAIFSWQGSVGAGKYILEISENADFSTVYHSEELYTTECMSTVTLQQGTTYYWRVRAAALSDNISGSEAVSQVYSFTAASADDSGEISPAVYSVADGKLTTWIYNTTGAGYGDEITLFAALYKGDSLDKANSAKISALQADTLTGPYEVTIDTDGGYDYAKIFVWNNESITPLSKAKIILP